MTTIENNLACHLIKESFGEIAKSIASLILNKKSYPLLMIANDLGLDKKQVSQILSILILHNLIVYQLNQKQIIEYKLNTKNVIDRLMLARASHFIQNFYDKQSELIFKEISIHGQLEMSSILLKLLSKHFNENNLKNKLNDSKTIDLVFNSIKESFTKLVEEDLIEKLPQIEKFTDEENNGNGNYQNDSNSNKNSNNPLKVPKFINNNDINKYLIPNLKIDDSRKQSSIESDFDLSTNKIRKPNESFEDNEIYWKLNYKKIFQNFQDQALIDAIKNRIDENAANILRVILRLTNTKITSEKAVQSCMQSKPITAIDIQKFMKNDYKMESITVDKYLNVILQDSIVEKVGEFSGGAYCVDFKKASYNLCLAHIESYVRERYGSKSLRIFKVVLDKLQLEQKQIEDFSMIPSKDCKSLLYNMLNDGILSVTELSKTSDHAPSRTFYLFYVDVYQVAKKILENAYKAISNLIIKREYLTVENKRLIEKNQKINSRVEILISQGAGQEEIEYEKSLISETDLKKLTSFTEYCNKIELAEIQLEETIFIFQNYFYYHTLSPVIPIGKNK